MLVSKDHKQYRATRAAALFGVLAVSLTPSYMAFDLQHRQLLAKGVLRSTSPMITTVNSPRLDDTSLSLDLSDILDGDTSEFLESLRRQMEGTNALNASPREVTNRIKGFFTVSSRTTEEIQTFRKYLEGMDRIMYIRTRQSFPCHLNTNDLLLSLLLFA
jgi:midasin (ATPase involved in ribosome maturation)